MIAKPYTRTHEFFQYDLTQYCNGLWIFQGILTDCKFTLIKNHYKMILLTIPFIMQFKVMHLSLNCISVKILK